MEIVGDVEVATYKKNGEKNKIAFKEAGREIASPSEARKILNIRKGQE